MSFGSNPRNIFQKTLKESHEKAGQPSDQQERISYGEIVDVNKDSQLKVKMYKSKGRGTDLLIMDGAWLPLLQPLNVIHVLYGRVHVGMKVRIFWTGKNEPKTAIIEVVGDADHNIEIKSPESNRFDTLPFKILSGGLGGLDA